jgi:hypothetical protein
MEDRKNQKTISAIKNITLIGEPTKEQLETFARRIAHDVRAYFNDEQIQKDFAKWQGEQSTA